MTDLNSQCGGSMTYTPSPPRFRVVLPDLSQVLDGHMTARRREKVRFAPFASVLGEEDATEKPLQDSPKPNKTASTPTNANRQIKNSPACVRGREDAEDEVEAASTCAATTNMESYKDLDTSASFSVDSFAFGNANKRSSSVSEPFAFILGSDDKENRDSIASVDEGVTSTIKPVSSDSYVKPPIRKVHQRRNQKKPKNSRVNSDWQSNIQEAKQIRELVEAKRRKGIQLNHQLNAHLTQQRVNDKVAQRQEILERTDKEVKFKSSVYQAHKQKIKEDAEEARRKSIAAREKLRVNRQEGAEKLKMMRIDEDKAIHEERYEASVALHTFKSDLAEDRRRSLKMRSEQAAFARDQMQQAHKEQRNLEHESFELKFEAAKDIEAYIESENEKRRQSIAGRNEAARKQRQQEADEAAKQARKEHELFELTLEADRDAAAYKEALKARDRVSLAHRGLETRRRRIKEEQLRARELEKEHESYELTWAGERDAEAHRKKLNRLQREDTALQNSEHRRKARVMNELRQLELEKEAESFVLKRAGEKDAERYLEKLAEDRRKSLQLRGMQTIRGREVEHQQRAEELRKQHEDEELRAAAHRDVEEYRKTCKERDRMSLQFRQKEARRKRLEEKIEAEKKVEAEHQSFELKTEDRKNVEEYVKECKQRRRMSLACRAKETKRHARWKQQQKQRELAQQRRMVHANMMDKLYEELARHEERVRLTQEAIRHSNGAVNLPPSH